MCHAGSGLHPTIGLGSYLDLELFILTTAILLILVKDHKTVVFRQENLSMSILKPGVTKSARLDAL
ncbi:hypothetical protein B6J67_13345 [Klebsiella quasipneumoniae]|nr:hypothetical protein B6J67_13345 [Klebsiella quasipneumoniae]PLJ62488.1 hypothetical protein B6J68_12365 [Klebsiella quasipneumoniae]